jgi:hypothetical protein
MVRRAFHSGHDGVCGNPGIELQDDYAAAPLIFEVPPPNLITTTRPSLQVSPLCQIPRVYHLSPVTSPHFLGGLLRQPRVRIDAKLLGGTTSDKALDSPQKSRGIYHRTTEIPQGR